MDPNAWTSVISTLGFPIACCVSLGVFIKYLIEKFITALKEVNAKQDERDRRHEEEVAALRGLYDSMKDTLVQNTTAIEKMNQTLTTLMQRSMDDGK